MTWHRTTVRARFLARVDAALGPCSHCPLQRRTVAPASHSLPPHGLHCPDDHLACET